MSSGAFVYSFVQGVNLGVELLAYRTCCAPLALADNTKSLQKGLYQFALSPEECMN